MWFSDLVATSSSRKKFAETLATFMDNWGFNGVDIDWEVRSGHAVVKSWLWKTDLKPSNNLPAWCSPLTVQ